MKYNYFTTKELTVIKQKGFISDRLVNSGLYTLKQYNETNKKEFVLSCNKYKTIQLCITVNYKDETIKGKFYVVKKENKEPIESFIDNNIKD